MIARAGEAGKAGAAGGGQASIAKLAVTSDYSAPCPPRLPYPARLP